MVDRLSLLIHKHVYVDALMRGTALRGIVVLGNVKVAMLTLFRRRYPWRD
jgi:hypothetical protein